MPGSLFQFLDYLLTQLLELGEVVKIILEGVIEYPKQVDSLDVLELRS